MDVEPRNDAEHLPSADSSALLALVRENVLELLEGFPRPPSALRIRVGGVTVEAEWAPAASPAPVPLVMPEGMTLPSSLTATPATATGSATRPESAAPSTPTGSGVEPEAGQVYLRAPAVGVLFHAPKPGAKPFVSAGDTVLAGQQVAIIEVMKLMIPVNADVDGTVVEALKADGAAVEYDEPLFVIAPLRS
jgi:acetyl-CoA carboxylase biotin carboxyl carrier protein